MMRATVQPAAWLGEGRRPVSTATAKPAGRRRLAIPAQHGAWAFLAVPLLLGFLIAGWSLPTALFAAAWVLAYPASYYLGRAVVIRWRRGTWSRLGEAGMTDAVPWMVLATIPAVALVVPAAVVGLGRGPAGRTVGCQRLAHPHRA
jgi:hypothetical protein